MLKKQYPCDLLPEHPKMRKPVLILTDHSPGLTLFVWVRAYLKRRVAGLKKMSIFI